MTEQKRFCWRWKRGAKLRPLLRAPIPPAEKPFGSLLRKGSNATPSQAQLTASGSQNRRFEFHKRSQLFIGAHDETLSVGMRVQSRSFALRNLRLKPSPSSIRLC